MKKDSYMILEEIWGRRTPFDRFSQNQNIESNNMNRAFYGSYLTQKAVYSFEDM